MHAAIKTDITIKGAVLPTRSYNIPPKGYPNSTPMATLPNIIPIIRDLVLSWYKSATKLIPDTATHAEAMPCRDRAIRRQEYD